MKVLNHDTAAITVVALVAGAVLCALGQPEIGGTLIATASTFAFTKPLIRGDN